MNYFVLYGFFVTLRSENNNFKTSNFGLQSGLGRTYAISSKTFFIDDLALLPSFNILIALIFITLIEKPVRLFFKITDY